jgi:hypothetical protein
VSANVFRLAALAFFEVAAPAVAGVSTEIPEQGAHDSYNISIINEATTDVHFELRPKEGAWSDYTLKSNAKGIYSCDNCGGKFDFHMSTAGVAVDYAISSGAPYVIRVNEKRNIYDLYLAR